MADIVIMAEVSCRYWWYFLR